MIKEVRVVSRVDVFCLLWGVTLLCCVLCHNWVDQEILIILCSRDLVVGVSQDSVLGVILLIVFRERVGEE